MNCLKSIDVLNLARAMELQAISQYMGQHYTLDDKNFPSLAVAMKTVALQEMHHAEMLGLRIRELGGVPVTALAGVPDTAAEMDYIYQADVTLETDTVDLYGTYIQELEGAGDYPSAQLLKKIIVEEEAHQQYFIDVLGHVNSLGANFLAVQASPDYSVTEWVKFTTK